ncbi:hypothetical protein RSOLAG22IIIB_04397 [Rhizoctonia solani]|uniref:Uncharacterized protein n=1 Tax=Rhizoctonia solani TaxID=456999 RepID=A0A0K6FY62_9AGAM|nr:hypothetical protein RSOLAG22IIIB_04397 [Rhizoctonia solani]
MSNPMDTPRLFAPEWSQGTTSFSDWMKACYESNKNELPFVFTTKLKRTVVATIAHEEALSHHVGDHCDPYYAYNGYVAALADITAYISKLLPEEQNDLFIATLTRNFEKRRQTALEFAEARVKHGFAMKICQKGGSPNLTRRFKNVKR